MTYNITSSDYVIGTRGMGLVDKFTQAVSPFSHTVLSFESEDGTVYAEINGLATDKYGLKASFFCSAGIGLPFRTCMFLKCKAGTGVMPNC